MRLQGGDARRSLHPVTPGELPDDAREPYGDVEGGEIEPPLIRPVEPVGEHGGDGRGDLGPLLEVIREGLRGDAESQSRRAGRHRGRALRAAQHAHLPDEIAADPDTEERFDARSPVRRHFRARAHSRSRRAQQIDVIHARITLAKEDVTRIEVLRLAQRENLRLSLLVEPCHKRAPGPRHDHHLRM